MIGYVKRNFSNQFYSKTPKRIFRNFANPLSILMLSLFSKFIKFVSVFSFKMVGKNFSLSC